MRNTAGKCAHPRTDFIELQRVQNTVNIAYTFNKHFALPCTTFLGILILLVTVMILLYTFTSLDGERRVSIERDS